MGQDQNHDDSQPFLIEGKLTNLHWELGRENLLAKIHKHYRGSSVVTGVGAAVGDLFGQVANSAMLAMYDGEDTQNFLCLINDEPACGQFGGAEYLPEGGNVKAVVSRRDGVLVVHAAMDEAREMVWINHPYGKRAEMWENVKIGLSFFLWNNIFFPYYFCLLAKKVSFGMISSFFIGGRGLSGHDPLAIQGPERHCQLEHGILPPARVREAQPGEPEFPVFLRDACQRRGAARRVVGHRRIPIPRHVFSEGCRQGRKSQIDFPEARQEEKVSQDHDGNQPFLIEGKQLPVPLHVRHHGF